MRLSQVLVGLCAVAAFTVTTAYASDDSLESLGLSAADKLREVADKVSMQIANEDEISQELLAQVPVRERVHLFMMNSAMLEVSKTSTMMAFQSIAGKLADPKNKVSETENTPEVESDKELLFETDGFDSLQYSLSKLYNDGEGVLRPLKPNETLVNLAIYHLHDVRKRWDKLGTSIEKNMKTPRDVAIYRERVINLSEVSDQRFLLLVGQLHGAHNVLSMTCALRVGLKQDANEKTDQIFEATGMDFISVRNELSSLAREAASRNKTLKEKIEAGDYDLNCMVNFDRSRMENPPLQLLPR